jgi:SpoVK/Ycf46/Vps4 family AAA+-type ATPase/TM2 domain-containing membrane protein YozV
MSKIKTKDKKTALVLSIFFGWFGCGRFYCKSKTGWITVLLLILAFIISEGFWHGFFLWSVIISWVADIYFYKNITEEKFNIYYLKNMNQTDAAVIDLRTEFIDPNKNKVNQTKNKVGKDKNQALKTDIDQTSEVIYQKLNEVKSAILANKNIHQIIKQRGQADAEMAEKNTKYWLQELMGQDFILLISKLRRHKKSSKIEYALLYNCMLTITEDNPSFITDEILNKEIRKEITDLFFKNDNDFAISAEMPFAIATLIQADVPELKEIYVSTMFYLVDNFKSKYLTEQEIQIIRQQISDPLQQASSLQLVEAMPDLSTHETLTMLNQLVGLEQIKNEVKKIYSYLQIQAKRKENGLVTPQTSLHIVFTGNPGTGKTTVARLMGKILFQTGWLSKGHLVEADRSAFIGGYMGQTAIKTNQLIDKALDGILFIDEAYSLSSETQNDYGNEAIATLLKRMEDERNRLVVIVAGYETEMKAFIASNPGFQSRFNRFLHFEDYSMPELVQILEKIALENDYQLDTAAITAFKDKINEQKSKPSVHFANARTVRNLFEKAIENQALRLANEENATIATLKTIKAQDFSD